ncbi:cytochrome d ubiquinol oxidase subunit II [Georgenia thermotolerans]|uniref:Cytochrome d ubiquinol oxidase subunit II n=1 Tax=Georgenia thermotolerans TaxID=527326 RepID=A0A7J5UPU9_9MICO|nr:cytochrome d ubiquinol oxidase subunit II [Georgenia thermotolerans]KAE8764435.1 cytochrome d ubiquinol oxidase subunit II [Georgenia thermotolerans]
MTLADVALAVLWLAVVAYLLFGGADFGAGTWDLLAGRGERGRPVRELIEHIIGPVWEANHVWLIFAIVMAWTAFPLAFASAAATLIIPLTLVAVGIIFRGSAFVFRKSVPAGRLEELFGVLFAASSVLTPFFLGAVAGALASGHVPYGTVGDVVGSWLTPASLFSGVMAVLVCAYLAAVYLTGDARRTGEHALAEYFRTRALVSGIVTGVVAVTGLVVIARYAGGLFIGLVGVALPFAVASAAAGAASLVLLALRRYGAVRLTAAAAVALVLVAWAAAQYPHLLQANVTVQQAAATDAVLGAVLVSLAVGAVLLVPSLVWLYSMFQRESRRQGADVGTGPSADA